MRSSLDSADVELGSVRASLVVLLLTVPALAQGAELSLAWDGNAEPDIAGYKVYYDVDSGPPYDGAFAAEGPSPIVVPLAVLADPTNPEFKLTGLPSCTLMFIAVTAYNTSDAESDFSNEAEATALAVPEIESVESRQPRSLTVAWTAPNDTGEVDHYSVLYDVDSEDPYDGTDALEGHSPISVPVADLADPTQPSFTLTGLQGGTMYFLQIESSCADGTTKTSSSSAGTPESSAPIDAGIVDSGAAIADAGQPAPDATPPTDAGPGEDEGCGCGALASSHRPPGTTSFLLLLGLGLLSRRRFRARSRGLAPRLDTSA